MKNMLEYQVCVIYNIKEKHQDTMLLVFYWDSHAFSYTKYKDYLASYWLYFKSKHHFIFLEEKKSLIIQQRKLIDGTIYSKKKKKDWCHDINAFSCKETVLTSYNNLVKKKSYNNYSSQF